MEVLLQSYNTVLQLTIKSCYFVCSLLCGVIFKGIFIILCARSNYYFSIKINT